MGSIFKTIGKGLFYVLFFPFGLLAILLYAIFGIFVFIYQFIKLIVLFFTGRSFKNELKEDIEAKKILEKNNPNNEEESKEESPLCLYPSDSIVYGSGYVSPSINSEPAKTVEEEKRVEPEPEKVHEDDIE